MADCTGEPSADSLSNQQQPVGPVQRILYLGPDLSFSSAAAHAVFPEPNQELVKAESFDDIFHRLQASADISLHGGRSLDCERYDYAIVPVANSTNGPVLPVVDLLRRCGEGTLLKQIYKHGVKGLDENKVEKSAPGNSAASYVEETSVHNDAPSAPLPVSQAPSGTTYPNIILRQPYTYALAVHHYLYVHPDCPIPAIDPGTSPDTLTSPPKPNPTISTFITSLHTHPQVWTQCTRFLASHFPNAHFPTSSAPLPPPPSSPPPDHCHPTPTKHDHPSTSSAALYVAEHDVATTQHSSTSTATSSPTPSRPQRQRQAHPTNEDLQGYPAAICSRLAGESHALKCVAAHIEDDREGNRTTFVVLGVVSSETVGR